MLFPQQDIDEVEAHRTAQPAPGQQETSMHFLEIDWVGVTPENGRKLLLSIVFITVVAAANWSLRKLANLVAGGGKGTSLQVRF